MTVSPEPSASSRSSRRITRAIAAVVVAVAAGTAVAGAAGSAAFPSDSASPDLVRLLAGYGVLWSPDGRDDLHGAVADAQVLERDDALAVWINQHATAAERFRALQDSEYQNAAGTAYDQSLTVSTGLGSLLGALYVQGRESGALPLTSALIDSTDGTAGAYVGTSAAKTAFSHPRPYLPASASAAPVAGDAPGCAPAQANASSLRAMRVGQPYADAGGDLDITRVPPATDATHRFSPHDVKLDAGYGTTSICLGGSFPSGHTATAYQAGITLATLLPELAPEILARASENGNDRIVLGVHYPLDVIGGRIAGEAALAARWSDARFRTDVLLPARAELLDYFRSRTGHSLEWAIRRETPYRSDPYDGARMPGGSTQTVTDRASAVAVYTERLSYGLPSVGDTGLPAAVPAGAANLLLTTFPTLSEAQRTSVLAQTEIASGAPLDQSSTGAGSWQRLDLAAAMSARVQLTAAGGVRVLGVGGAAAVIPAASARAPATAGCAPVLSPPALALPGREGAACAPGRPHSR